MSTVIPTSACSWRIQATPIAQLYKSFCTSSQGKEHKKPKQTMRDPLFYRDHLLFDQYEYIATCVDSSEDCPSRVWFRKHRLAFLVRKAYAKDEGAEGRGKSSAGTPAEPGLQRPFFLLERGVFFLSKSKTRVSYLLSFRETDWRSELWLCQLVQIGVCDATAVSET